MAVKSNKEITSFKLLEEDQTEMKPTQGMKEFVSKVLDKKGMKDKDVACSFRNLTEYRDPVSSPPVTNAQPFLPDILNPESPLSPQPVQMDDDRLPNELLDEICEDIGMKEGMELDFVEFLMEQDEMDPHTYMTPEALTTGVYKNQNTNNSNTSLSQPIIKQQEMKYTPSSDIQSQLPASFSPDSKRFHVCSSEPSSPAKYMSSQSKQQQQQQFKVPPMPLTPKRQLSTAGNKQFTNIHMATKRSYSPSSFSQQQSTLETNKMPGTIHYGSYMNSPRTMCTVPSKHNTYNPCTDKPTPSPINTQMYQQQRWMSHGSELPDGRNNEHHTDNLENNSSDNPNPNFSLSMDGTQNDIYSMKNARPISGIHSSHMSKEPVNFTQDKSVLPSNSSIENNSVNKESGQPSKYESSYSGQTNCFEDYKENTQTNMQSKILPRISNLKSEISPYTLPSAIQSTPYDQQQQQMSSCSVNHMTQSGQPLQTYNYNGKDDMYYIDRNQNMMPIEPTDYSRHYQGNYNNGLMTDQMKAMLAGLPDHQSSNSSTGAGGNSATSSTPSQLNYNNDYSVPDINDTTSMATPINQYSQNTGYNNTNSNLMNTGNVPTPYQNQQAFNPMSYGQNRPHVDASMYSSNLAAGNQWMGSSQNLTENMRASNKPVGLQTMNLARDSNSQELLHHNPEIDQGMSSSHMHPCSQPNVVTNCKSAPPTNRPPILASQQSFIQHLITDRSNAFRSHPLFPLLRDLIIADMNFCSPNFPYQLISNLPADFDKLLQNFLQRNPPTGNYQGNYAVESVIMDALRYAHQCIIEKIRLRQDQDKQTKSSSKSLSAIEEFCEKFDRAVRNNVTTDGSSEQDNRIHLQSGGDMTAGGYGCITDRRMVHGSVPMDPNMCSQEYMAPGVGKVLGMPCIRLPQNDQANIYNNPSAIVNKAESKKHPSLPKEAVAMMLDWLRNHKDNPYPNDDEKAMLIKQTGLTINQINYWFTNARRRILPKWAQCK